ncbi:ion channel [Enterobacter mori]|uniref:ion channel n=1 Tax=Enterobacter mori TaxID=539813 RepID=UPI003D1F8A86
MSQIDSKLGFKKVTSWKSRVWAGIYFSIVILFAVLYYGFWLLKPDSFIINSELNVHPFYDMNVMLWSDENYDYPMGNGIDLNVLKKENDEYILKLSKDKSDLEKIDSELADLDNEFYSVYKKKEAEFTQKTKEYEQEMLSDFIAHEKALEASVANLEKDSPVIVKTNDDVMKIQRIGDERVRLAEARLETARQSFKIADYILKNLMLFTSKETRDDLIKLNEQRTSYNDKRFKLVKEMGDKRSAAIDNVGRYYKQYMARLNIIDFIYFSVGISTTTTFGDIVASDRLIRAFVSLQLLLCIFIVGGFLNSVMNKN